MIQSLIPVPRLRKYTKLFRRVTKTVDDFKLLVT